jgi:hypothetical protein
MQLVEAYAVLTTLVIPWLWYRHRELYRLAGTVYEAAKDREVTEEEFQAIADRLGEVLYKEDGTAP